MTTPATSRPSATSSPAFPPVPRLVILTPLLVEQLALGPNARSWPGHPGGQAHGDGPGQGGAGPPVRLSAAPAPAAVAVAGLGGALIDGLVPGDLVVADRLIDATGEEVIRLAVGAPTGR